MGDEETLPLRYGGGDCMMKDDLYQGIFFCCIQLEKFSSEFCGEPCALSFADLSENKHNIVWRDHSHIT